MVWCWIKPNSDSKFYPPLPFIQYCDSETFVCQCISDMATSWGDEPNRRNLFRGISS
jgi:hypothetical protein